VILRRLPVSCSLRSLNTLFIHFTPQTHHSLSIVMRLAGPRRRVLSKEHWRALSTHIETRRVSKGLAAFAGEQQWFRLLTPIRCIVDEYPDYVCVARRAALVIDYRLLVGVGRFYHFYRRAVECARDIAGGFERVEGAEHRGLLGLAPRGLYPDAESPGVLGCLRERARVLRIGAPGGDVAASLRELDSGLSDDVAVDVVVLFPSSVEEKLFGGIVSSQQGLEAVVSEASHIEAVDSMAPGGAVDPLAGLLGLYDAVVVLSTDPLALLNPSMEAVKTLLSDPCRCYRVFMVFYAGLYFNLARLYYERLYPLVGTEKYMAEARRIPILALGLTGSYGVPGFLEALPVSYTAGGSRRAEARVISPDVTVCSTAKVYEFLRTLPRRLVKELHVSVSVETASRRGLGGESPVLEGVEEHLKRYVLEKSREYAASRVLASHVVRRRVHVIDNLRRETL